MRKMIINADDLGMSHEVNSQIEKCINLGCITSCSLMANAPAFEEGVTIAKKYPQISVGVHLNLIEFAPLTNTLIFRRHGLLSDDGSFIEGAIFCVPIDVELKRAVFEEWDAQLTKVEQAGLTPSHCDSHEHTHTITGLQAVLQQVLEKHHVTKVRRKVVPSIRMMIHARKQPILVQLDKSKAMLPIKRNIIYRRLHIFTVIRNNRRWNKALMGKYTMTDAFYSFREFYSNRDLLNHGNKIVAIELMCHPGNVHFQNETEKLMENRDWQNGFELITYRDI